MTKTCKKCTETKDIEEFPKQKSNKDGRLGICRVCNRERINKNSTKYREKNREKINAYQVERNKLNPEKRKEYDARYKRKHGDSLLVQKAKGNCKTHYKITYEQYLECMSTSEVCEICGKDHDLCYDHDHTKEGIEAFRGVLCRQCNSSLGGLGDNLESVLKAVKYLQK